MKKQIKFLAILGLSTLCFSCTKDNVVTNTEFKATLEAQSPQLRTSLGNEGEGESIIEWTQNPADIIKIFTAGTEGTDFTLTSVSNGVGSFAGSIEEAKEYFAAYPSTFVDKFESSTFNLNIPATQNYYINNISTNTFPMVALAGEDKVLNFKNLMGVLRLKLIGTATLTKVEVVSENNALNGKGSLDMKMDTSNPTISMPDVNETNKSITYLLGEGITLSAEETVFNIVLPPTKGEDLSLLIRFYTDETNFIEKIIPNKEVNRISRSQITSMPTFELVEAPTELEYVDEYGVNHGVGIEIGGIKWAPVNCGYHETDLVMGKLYQWGRKDGQSLASDVIINTEAITDFVTAAETLDSETFYTSWSNPPGNMWGGEDGATKTAYDPCPEGWRVPSQAELQKLIDAGYTYFGNPDADPDLNKGRWFGPNHATASFENHNGCIYIPFPGYRQDFGSIRLSDMAVGLWANDKPSDRAFVNLYMMSEFATTLPSTVMASRGYSVRCIEDVKPEVAPSGQIEKVKFANGEW